jgi:hypothetical protein
MAKPLPYFAQVLDNTGRVSEVWKNYFLSLDGGGGGGVESVSGTTNRITVTGTANRVVNIATNYAGQTSITTLGTIATGTWQGTTVAIGYGGTGLTTLGTAGQLLAVNGAGTALEYINPPTPLSAGNPAAQVGLAAVNGVASTYMRSDAAPALDVGISPTWTGAHAFTQLSTLAGGALFNTAQSSAQGKINRATVEGLTIRGIAGSTNDFTLYSADAGALLTNPTGTRNLNVGHSSGTAAFLGVVTMASTLSVTGAVTLTALAGSGTRYVTADASGVLGSVTGAIALTDAVILAPSTSARNVIQSTADAVIPLTVRARAAQAASVFEAQNSGGTALAWITNIGDFRVERSSSGSTVQSRLVNSSNTNLSSAEQYISVGGTSSGDPTTLYNVTGGSQWSVGIDNSNSDAFVIALGGTLGTNNRLHITTAGAMTIPDLAGSGSRMVVADSNGLLSTIAIPTGSITGSGSANQVAVFSSASAIGGSGNFTFDGSTLAVTGAQTLSSTLTASGDIILTQSSALIRSNTADASDNKSITLAGGGGSANTRGGSVIAYGNEFASFGGQVQLVAGNASSGGIIFITNGSLRYTLNNSGAHAFLTAVSMSSTLSVLGDTILGGSGTAGNVLEVTGSSSGQKGVRINPADGGTPILELMDGGSTVAGEYWQVYKNNTTHAMTFYNGSDRLTISAAGLVSIPGAATVTGTTTLSSLSGTITRVMLADASGVVSVDNALNFNGGLLELTGSMQMSGDLTIGGEVAANGGIIPGTGTDVLDVYENDSATISWSTGWTTTPTCTLYYTKVGHAVTIRMSAFTATSNATSAQTAAGAAPASIRPASGNVYIAVWLYNNSLPEVGFLEINAGGQMTLNRGAAPSFTASGTKGLVGTVSGGYSLTT